MSFTTDDDDHDGAMDITTPLIDKQPQKMSTYGQSTSLSGSFGADESENEIRNKLQWYFKNPYEKYKQKKRKPAKLVLQIIKIILVTVQAIFFATDEFQLVTFRTDNIETFRQLFLLHYDGHERQELFLKDSVYQHMHHTWLQYYQYQSLMIGTYHTPIQSIKLCVEESVIAETIKPNGTFPWSKAHPCYHLKPPKESVEKITWQEFKEDNRLPKHFELISRLRMIFEFQVNYTVLHRSNSPDCYQFNITVLYDNSDLDGEMAVTLDSEIDFHQCRITTGLHIREQSWWNYTTLFDIVVILICIISFILCLRSFRRHYRLCKAAEFFFKDYRHEKFTFTDKLNFINFWLVLIAVSDICIIAGSTIKIVLDWLEYPELYDACSLSFGIAVLFSWVGILRYLGFMQGYNVLLVTLKTSFPSIIRFIICSSLIYIGFTICGWIVLGPYHYKFVNLYVTSECLFALVNGDDMYTTFHSIVQDDSDPLIWYFNKVYLYVFISLFIYVVLSLFIGIVADTYERIKDYGHPPKTRIELFMEGKEYANAEHQHRHGGCKQHLHHHRNRPGEGSGDEDMSINNQYIPSL
ncbi:mucolipin-3-like [Clytia hemisphaerica]|eukprot:TCONS_00061470-protein